VAERAAAAQADEAEACAEDQREGAKAHAAAASIGARAVIAENAQAPGDGARPARVFCGVERGASQGARARSRCEPPSFAARARTHESAAPAGWSLKRKAAPKGRSAGWLVVA